MKARLFMRLTLIRKCLPKSEPREQGFTLIETSIALVIMMIGALAITSLFSFAISYNSDAADRAVALAVGQKQMERLRTLSFSDTLFTDGTTSQAVTMNDRSYTVTTTIGGSSTLKTINVQVTPLGAIRPWAAGPVTLIGLRTIVAPGAYFKY